MNIQPTPFLPTWTNPAYTPFQLFLIRFLGVKKERLTKRKRERVAYFVDGTLICSPENFLFLKDKEIIEYTVEGNKWLIPE